MAKTCYQKKFIIQFTIGTVETIITFSHEDIRSLKTSPSCFWCGDSAVVGKQKPATHEKPLDITVLRDAIIEDLKNDSSPLYGNAPLRELYKKNASDPNLFITSYKPTQEWKKILNEQDIIDKCKDAQCSDSPTPSPAVPALPVEPLMITNESGDCCSAKVEVTKDGNTITLKLLTRDKKLPKKDDLTTTLLLSRYIVDTKYPDWLKTAGSISVKFLETPAWRRLLSDSGCDDRTVIGMLLKGAKCGTPEDSTSTKLYVKLPNLFPSAMTIVRQLDVKNYQSKTKNVFPGFNAFFIDSFTKASIGVGKFGAMTMRPYSQTEESTVKPWKITAWVDSFAVNSAYKNYVRAQTRLFEDENTVVLHSMGNPLREIDIKDRYIPYTVSKTSAVPEGQITMVRMVFRIPFTATFDGKITWETKRNDNSFNAPTQYKYPIIDPPGNKEPSLIGYIKVAVQVPCVHPRRIADTFDVWRCNITKGEEVTVDTLLIPTFFHHYRPTTDVNNDMQTSIKEYQRNYWGDTKITDEVNTNNFPPGYTGHLTIPDLWELALSKATVYMKKMPNATGIGLFDKYNDAKTSLTLSNLRESIISSMAFCDCADNFKLIGGWKISFKNIATGQKLGDTPSMYMEYNQDISTFTLSSSGEFGSVNDRISIDKATDIDEPRKKYIKLQGDDQNLNFKAPQ